MRAPRRVDLQRVFASGLCESAVAVVEYMYSYRRETQKARCFSGVGRKGVKQPSGNRRVFSPTMAACSTRPVGFRFARHTRGAATLAVPLGAALGAMAGLAIPLARRRRTPARPPGSNTEWVTHDLHDRPTYEAGRHLARTLLLLEDDPDCDAHHVTTAWARVEEKLRLPNAYDVEEKLRLPNANGSDGGNSPSSMSGIGGCSGSQRLITLVHSLWYAGVDAQVALIERAAAASIQPDAAVLNAILERGQVEGRDPSTDKTLMGLLRDAPSDDETRWLLARTPEDLQFARTAALKGLTARSRLLLPRRSLASTSADMAFAADASSLADAASAAEAASVAPSAADEATVADAAHRAAWLLFDGLLSRQVATTHQLNVMLRDACATTDEQLALVDRAAAAGAHADVRGFTSILHVAHLEGSAAAVDAIVGEMARLGVARDDVFDVLLRRRGHELSALRTAALKRLLRDRGFATAAHRAHAWQIFDRLVAAGQADAYQLSLMMRCATASVGEARALLARAEASGLVPNVAAFNCLLWRLTIQGGLQDAIHEVLGEMGQRGVRPDASTRRLAEHTEEELSRMRTAELRYRMRIDDDDANAWELFSRLVDLGLVQPGQVAAMAPAVRRVERGDGPSLPDEHRHLANYFHAKAQMGT